MKILNCYKIKKTEGRNGYISLDVDIELAGEIVEQLLEKEINVAATNGNYDKLLAYAEYRKMLKDAIRSEGI